MPIYTFYTCNLGGGVNACEGVDVGSDAEAPSRALQMLNDHPSSSYVAVWSDERAPKAIVAPSRTPPPTLALEEAFVADAGCRSEPLRG